MNKYEKKGTLCFWDFCAGSNTATLAKNIERYNNIEIKIKQ